jgi:hypothetical protein
MYAFQLAYQKHSYTVPSGAMGRRKREGNYSPTKIISYRIQRKMKKMDTQFLTPTNQ